METRNAIEEGIQMLETLENSATLAGHYYNLRCPIAAEAKKGKTWADVH